jgi:hypothetical protein
MCFSVGMGAGLQCVKMVDVLRDEPGKLLKRVLKENTAEYKKPNDRSTVTGTPPLSLSLSPARTCMRERDACTLREIPTHPHNHAGLRACVLMSCVRGGYSDDGGAPCGRPRRCAAAALCHADSCQAQYGRAARGR